MAPFQPNDELWVFLSHSNNDYEQVRCLRNIMEEKGMRPLMFFLKCLDEEPEIFNLIKREIDVRPRFILCDSENAQKSEWVQKEVEYIKSKYFDRINVKHYKRKYDDECRLKVKSLKESGLKPKEISEELNIPIRSVYYILNKK